MDKEIFDSMCDRYEARIRFLQEELDRCYGTIRQNAMSDVCVKKGGHEFENKSGTKMCVYCGFNEYR